LSPVFPLHSYNKQSLIVGNHRYNTNPSGRALTFGNDLALPLAGPQAGLNTTLDFSNAQHSSYVADVDTPLRRALVECMDAGS